MKMVSYQYDCEDETIVTDLHNAISYSDKMTSLYPQPHPRLNLQRDNLTISIIHASIVFEHNEVQSKLQRCLWSRIVVW